MSDQPQIPGHEWHLGEYPSSQTAVSGAKSYQRAQGLPETNPADVAGVRADPNKMLHLGKTVERQQGGPSHISPQMQASYVALNREVNQQFDHMTRPESQGGMGMSYEATADDPYPSPSEMHADMDTNKRIKVLESGDDYSHPHLDREANNRFRAVHDVFGHGATGRNFSRHGEEAAAQHHSTMFSPEAQPALMSELRGQNSALITSGGFVENKPYDLPGWASKKDMPVPEAPKPKPQGEQQRFNI